MNVRVNILTFDIIKELLQKLKDNWRLEKEKSNFKDESIYAIMINYVIIISNIQCTKRWNVDRKRQLKFHKIENIQKRTTGWKIKVRIKKFGEKQL